MKKAMEAFEAFMEDLRLHQDLTSKPRVMVVEDNIHDADLISAHLYARDCEVYVCKDGEKALEELKSIPDIKCVFVDLKLPRMSGIEVVRKIKEEKPKMGVILLTGFCNMDAEALEQATALGVVVFCKND